MKNFLIIFCLLITITVQAQISTPYHSKEFIDSDRLNFDLHLTECNSGLNIFIPQNESLYGIGYLMQTTNNFINGIGFSKTTHYDSTNSKNIKSKCSLYFLTFNNRIGITFYVGDYQGLDIDINVLKYNWIKYYICIRNFGEVFDFKLDLTPIEFLMLTTELRNKEFILMPKFYKHIPVFGISPDIAL